MIGRMKTKNLKKMIHFSKDNVPSPPFWTAFNAISDDR
jgi:hypothetical protein